MSALTQVSKGFQYRVIYTSLQGKSSICYIQATKHAFPQFLFSIGLPVKFSVTHVLPQDSEIIFSLQAFSHDNSSQVTVNIYRNIPKKEKQEQTQGQGDWACGFYPKNGHLFHRHWQDQDIVVEETERNGLLYVCKIQTEHENVLDANQILATFVVETKPTQEKIETKEN